MTKTVRFGVSLDRDLLKTFDRVIRGRHYTNRSEAIRDLIRDNLVQKEWEDNKEVAGAVMLLYNHNQRELVSRLMNIQHQYHHAIISTQHIHLDHTCCLEIVVLKTTAAGAHELFNALKSQRGVKHAGFTVTSTGAELA